VTNDDTASIGGFSGRATLRAILRFRLRVLEVRRKGGQGVAVGSNRRIRRTSSIVAALAIVLCNAVSSSAAVSGKLGAMITNSDTLKCGGSMSTSLSENENTVGVSYVCQYAVVGSSTWTNHGTIPASTCSNCAGTNYHSVTWETPCWSLSLTKNYLFRAHVDGWWVDGTGLRHDVDAINSGTIQINCSGSSSSSSGKLAALVSDYYTTAGTGPYIACGGSNTMNPQSPVQYILVSYVCQKAPSGSTSFFNVGSAPATSSLYPGTGYASVSINCSNLGSGTWNVRAHVDGYWIDTAGTRHDQTDINSPVTLSIYC
jgi:hypothetical protein